LAATALLWFLLALPPPETTMTPPRSTFRDDFLRLGINPGDVVLARAAYRAVGKPAAGGGDFLAELLDLLGDQGTVACLAFTRGGFRWQAAQLPPYTPATPSYAGALPNAMLAHPGAHRSLHPQCSFVAIGRHAQALTAGHGPADGAYEPMRKLIALNAKMLVAGCVATNPGFTTTHLAEVDLGLHRRRIGRWWYISRYLDAQGRVRIFQRRDPGCCSNSYWKFYAEYVRHGVLTTGKVGNAYAICAPASECYAIERAILARDRRFNLCGSPDCLTCNALRWDRIHRWPAWLLRRVLRPLRTRAT
jgi:aminoglycoside N3'-acetyltransferase